MGKINLGRVIMGGLLAGLVINVGEVILNIPILGAQWEAAMAALGGEPAGGGEIVYYVIVAFLLGIAMVWLYAAMRPRLGAGPKTAVITGLVVWFVTYSWGIVGTALAGLFPTGLVVSTVIWGFFEFAIAAVAGAWLYQEEGAGAAAAAAAAAPPPPPPPPQM